MIQRIKHTIYQILKYSEKYTKTDMVYLAKGGFWLSLNNIVIAVITLVISIAFANLLPREIYGQYKYAIAVFAILKLFTLEGMGTAVTQAVARNFEGVVKKALRTRILWGVIGSLIGFSLTIYYYFAGNPVLAVTFFIIGIFVPLFDSFSVYIPYLNGKKLFPALAKLRISVEVVSAAVLIVALFLTDNLFVILISYFLPHATMRIIFYFFAIRKYKLNQKIDDQVISYGKHLSIMAVISQIADNIDKILLWHLLGAIPVAIYSFAVAIPNQLKSFVKEIKILALPKLSAQDPAVIKKTLTKKILKTMLILVPVVAANIILAPFIFTLFFPQYIESIFYSQIFALSILLAPQMLFKTHLEAHIKKKRLYFINFFTPSIRILLFIFLIPIYGIIGAMLSIIIARSINFGLLYYLFKTS